MRSIDDEPIPYRPTQPEPITFAPDTEGYGSARLLHSVSAGTLLIETIAPFSAERADMVLEAALSQLADEIEVLSSAVSHDEGLIDPRTFANVLRGYESRLRVLAVLSVRPLLVEAAS